MTVSANTQTAFWSNPADDIELFGTDRDAADAFADEMKAMGCKARVYSWNNGSKAKPRIEFKVHVWGAR